jgi:hypothetical protein
MMQVTQKREDDILTNRYFIGSVALHLTKKITNMQTGLLHLHNLLRWIIFILLLVSIIKAYSGWKGKKIFSAGDAKVWLFTMIASHVTLLLGLYQWLMGRYGLLTFEIPEGTSRMKDTFIRFFQVEHPVSMLLAIVFITLGRGMAKKQVSDTDKYRKAFIYFLLGLILILAAVPWPFRGEVIGRPLFPGM